MEGAIGESVPAALETLRQPSWQLLDVLDTLPIPLLRHSLWPWLNPAAQHALSLTSSRALRLAERLTSTFTLAFPRCPDAAFAYDGMAGVCDADGPQQPETPEGGFQLLGTSLGRLEHISALHLKQPRSEADTEEGLRLGHAGCRHVSHMRVSAAVDLTAVTGSALRCACPALSLMELHDTQGSLDPAFVTQLAAAQHLSEVHLRNSPVSAAVIHALASLPSLTALHIVVDHAHELRLPPAHGGWATDWVSQTSFPLYPGLLMDTAALIGLRELHLEAALFGHPLVLHTLGNLFTLTRLTSLHLQTVDARNVGAPARGYPSLRGGADEALNVSLLRLGRTLHRLEHLSISHTSTRVDDSGAAGLLQMTRLTTLHADRICMTFPAAPGSLPHLRSLTLLQAISGAELLHLVEALLPLPHLALLHASLSVRTAAHMGPDSGEYALPAGEVAVAWAAAAAAYAAEDLVALHAAAQHLAGAPHLRPAPSVLAALFDLHSITTQKSAAAAASSQPHIRQSAHFLCTRLELPQGR